MRLLQWEVSPIPCLCISDDLHRASILKRGLSSRLSSIALKRTPYQNKITAVSCSEVSVLRSFCGMQNVLISCSLDSSIKVWQPIDPPTPGAVMDMSPVYVQPPEEPGKPVSPCDICTRFSASSLLLLDANVLCTSATDRCKKSASGLCLSINCLFQQWEDSCQKQTTGISLCGH